MTICNDILETGQVLRINYISPRPSLAGGTKSTRLICEAMVRRGHDVRIIFPVKSGNLPPLWRIRTFIKHARKRLLSVLKPPSHHLLTSTAKLIPVPKTEVEASDVPDADVTICSWWRSMEFVQNWPADKGIKVHYIRGHEIWAEEERVARLYRSECLKVVNSHWLNSLMQSKYGLTAVVVHNGIDRDQFDSIPRARTHDGCVGFVYSHQPVKDAETALAALRLVQQEIPGLRVNCFGASPLASGLKLPNSFNFRFSPNQSEISDIYRSADCWVIPSRSEGLPMPGLEAAACRCPIVATRCGGTEDYVRDGVNGYLVPVGDARVMADRILDVLRAPSNRWTEMSEACYEISKGFDWDRSAENLERFLVSSVRLSRG